MIGMSILAHEIALSPYRKAETALFAQTAYKPLSITAAVGNHVVRLRHSARTQEGSERIRSNHSMDALWRWLWRANEHSLKGKRKED